MNNWTGAMSGEPCERHEMPWCAECAGHTGRARRVETPSPPPVYDGPRPAPADILISPTSMAHHSGCSHLPDHPWLVPPKWGWVDDPTVWPRIGNGHTVQATLGNTDRVAERRCSDCDA